MYKYSLNEGPRIELLPYVFCIGKCSRVNTSQGKIVANFASVSRGMTVLVFPVLFSIYGAVIENIDILKMMENVEENFGRR